MGDEIIKLFNSNISAYQISKDTGVNEATIKQLRLGKSKLDRLGLLNAEKLYNYQKEIEGK
ncbi:XRE family transcriptional regulator [Staphylococcus simiae]|uniref:XRE family transcriptional regulator n=1 Tax=Staphylococcus simiae TaxID=308354 RepID=UPI001A96A42E|nr:XRE family transcriptional regulator [Staphylococcus simiae]MBO1199937.1 XRE family transcriptional regulator [Staphylococcus simiae]MBO1202210.1 XRE family transcriptional regulator [Staphylococcus simiae]MBO1204468.1 XRE family transcriptional regulator [Staphylococcus simiae]MBO1212008.1 XRE family transcriptional regulator [Staphylococcus simiae]MBO1230642.1 XRE family transcriptional regulator [Staphylococcus simiae]